MITPSTFSIVAHDPAENAWGIAVASKFPAVGAVVPWAQAEVGAVATQSYANTSFGPRGLELMSQGHDAEETLERLLGEDEGREKRQVGVVDERGNPATFTEGECHPWAGGKTADHVAVQGNILTGPEVVDALLETCLDTEADLPTRLHRALLAADRGGGDRRGRQSAALYVVKPEGGYGGYTDRWIDYRVDDHPDPVKRLGDLLEMHKLYFGRSPEDERVRLEGEPLKHLQELMAELGYYQGQANGRYDPATRAAVEAFIGNENFEERSGYEEGWIDRPVYDFLIRRFGSSD
jgi:uncharacterized Ntn-hydrolase superfamily protein